MLEPRNFAQDYNTNEGKTQKIINSITKETNLVCIPLKGQGYIFTNNDNKDKIDELLKDPDNDINIAKALGFPCEGFPDNYNYAYRINIEYKDKIDDILAVICEDETQEENFKKLRDDIKTFVSNNDIDAVISLEKHEIISIEDCINSVKNDEINNEIKTEIENYMENIGINDIDEKIFDNKNKNILLVLLSYYKNDPFSSFYPLTQYELKDVNEKMKEWKECIESLL